MGMTIPFYYIIIHHFRLKIKGLLLILCERYVFFQSKQPQKAKNLLRLNRNL